MLPNAKNQKKNIYLLLEINFLTLCAPGIIRSILFFLHIIISPLIAPVKHKLFSSVASLALAERPKLPIHKRVCASDFPKSPSVNCNVFPSNVQKRICLTPHVITPSPR